MSTQGKLLIVDDELLSLIHISLSAKVGDIPMPEYTGRVMSRIPDFIPVWSLVLGGIYWISHRREEVAAAESEEKNGSAR